MNFIKIFFIIFFTLTSTAYSTSDEYYRMTFAHLLANSDCNTECKKLILEQEIKVLFIEILEKLLKQIELELLEERRKVATVLK